MLDKQTKTHWIPKSSIPFEDKKKHGFSFRWSQQPFVTLELKDPGIESEFRGPLRVEDRISMRNIGYRGGGKDGFLPINIQLLTGNFGSHFKSQKKLFACLDLFFIGK